MLKHFVRGRLGWILLHITVILLMLLLGHFITF